MKRLISPILVLVITFASISPVLPQKSVTGSKPRSQATLTVGESVQFENTRALTDGESVLIEWQTAVEKDNYGFIVYRHDGNGRQQVGEDLVHGSYFSVGKQRTFGQQYSILDRQGSLESVYVVEAVMMNGSRSSSKEIAPVYTESLRGAPGFAEAEAESLLLPGQLVEDRLTYTKYLQEEMINNALVPDPNTHRWVIAQPGVKLGVRSNGMYRVTSAELSAAGFNTASDPNLWQLYVEGNEQAIVVGPGGSYVEFYGEGVDRVESDTQAYYLIIGTSAGKRAQTRVARPNSGTVVMPRYDQTAVFKERTTYLNTIFNGDAENYWGRSVINSPSTTYSFALSGTGAASGTARVTVYFQGTSSGDHQVNLVLNGNALGSAIGSAVTSFNASFDIPAASLIEGTNALQMTSNAAGDSSLFDRVEVSYARRFLAGSGRLFFYTQDDRKASLEGFASSNVRVFDTTIEGEMTELTNLAFVAQGPTFGAEMPAARGRRFVAFDQSAFFSPSAITPNDQAMLSDPANAANFVIISHRNFLTQSEAWAEYRRTQGVTVKVIDVNDIYDEFNYGVVRADAIKAFLNMTYTTWATAPDYVLLMGDWTIDPRNYRGAAFAAYVPTRMIDGTFEESGSDEFLADFDGDELAEMAVGRIAARNATTINTVFAKTQNWEANLVNTLNRGALFAHDRIDGFDFEALNGRLRNQIPGDMPSTMVHRDEPNAQANLVAAMNGGKFFVNYSGHGTAGAWAASSFFANSTVSQLNNVNNESIFTMLTCLNGYFILPTTNSLAENVTHAPNGGAVAAWASTGQTTPDIQELMATRFFFKLGEGQIPRLGDLIRDAKVAIPGGSDVRLSWALLGDPMLKVRQVPAPDFIPSPVQKTKLR